jgi:hypothetical protein
MARLDPLCFGVLAAGVFWLVVLAARELILTPWLPLSDESFHHVWALRIWQDCVQLDLRALLRDTYNQQLNPFLGSYLAALAMLVGGPTQESTRMGSLVAGVLGLFALSYFSAILARRKAWLAAGVTLALWGSSPIFLFYACRTMKDAYALLFTVLCFLAAARFVETQGRLWAFLTGLLAAATFLTKYNTGIQVLAALALGLAWPEVKKLAVQPRQVWHRVTHPWILLPAAAIVPIAVWAMAGGVRAVVNFLQGFPFAPMTLEEHLLYYPRALASDYVVARALVGVPAVALAYWLVRGWSDARIRVALIYVLINLVAAVQHIPKDARFIWPAGALLMALGGVLAARLVARAGQRAQVGWTAAVTVALALCVWSGPRALRQYTAQMQPIPTPSEQNAVRRAVAFLKENLPLENPVLLAGAADHGLQVQLLKQMLWDPGGREPQIRELPYPGFPAVWGFSMQASSRYLELLNEALAQQPNASLLIVEHAAGTAFRGGLYSWIFAWQENYLSAATQVRGWGVVAQTDAGEGLQVRIYRRLPNPEKAAR